MLFKYKMKFLTAKRILQIATMSAAIAVVFGAFGAHGLKKTLSESMLIVYRTGVDYHLMHSLALLAVGILILLLNERIWLKRSAMLFMIGIVLFSGSLYLLSVGGPRWLGPITPLGGLSFIAGWLSLAVGISKSNIVSLKSKRESIK